MESNPHSPTPAMVRVRRLWFWCPGCDQAHAVVVEAPAGHGAPLWTWNGDEAAPTVQPSILVQMPETPQRSAIRCHSFLEGGRLRFLPDSSHALNGSTVEPPELPDFLAQR